MTRGEVAPVGEASQKVRQGKPELELYAADGTHPSKLGSYVAAMVIYGTVGGVEMPEQTRAWLERMVGEVARSHGSAVR